MWVILGLCWVCSLMEKMVAGGWVWVILGLCWVCSSMEKTVTQWRGRWLGVGDFGFVLGL